MAIVVRVEKESRRVKEVPATSEDPQRIRAGSRFHAAFKSSANGLIADRMAFAVIWVVGQDAGSTLRAARYTPPTWDLFRIDSIADAGDCWMVELTEVMHWESKDSVQGLADIFASDYGDSY